MPLNRIKSDNAEPSTSGIQTSAPIFVAHVPPATPLPELEGVAIDISPSPGFPRDIIRTLIPGSASTSTFTSTYSESGPNSGLMPTVQTESAAVPALQVKSGPLPSGSLETASLPNQELGSVSMANEQLETASIPKEPSKTGPMTAGPPDSEPGSTPPGPLDSTPAPAIPIFQVGLAPRPIEPLEDWTSEKVSAMGLGKDLLFVLPMANKDTRLPLPPMLYVPTPDGNGFRRVMAKYVGYRSDGLYGVLPPGEHARYGNGEHVTVFYENCVIYYGLPKTVVLFKGEPPENETPAGMETEQQALVAGGKKNGGGDGEEEKGRDEEKGEEQLAKKAKNLYISQLKNKDEKKDDEELKVKEEEVKE